MQKAADQLCRHCVLGSGCAHYDTRPKTCRDFLCDWMKDPALDAAWNPLAAHMMLYSQGAQKTVLVDPAYPHIWQSAPYAGLLQDLAEKCEQEGGYLILFCGDEVRRIRSAKTERPPEVPTA
ncbi:hypothetical protein ACFSE1_00505 [Rhizobium helianthi]|uniref:Zinc/iron-chelating domain-containing protein n=1 Tax=Rhizobium helianthi TaxID=1132695 RepID=A0ABW4LYH4_9HYPH